MYRQIMQILDTWDTFSHLSHTFFFLVEKLVCIILKKEEDIQWGSKLTLGDLTPQHSLNLAFLIGKHQKTLTSQEY